MLFEDITKVIIGCAIDVHKELGPGFLESAYEECLYYELQKAGLKVEKQKAHISQYLKTLLYCYYFILIFLLILT